MTSHRHRLNRGGDRGANNALYTVVLSRLRCDPAPAATSSAAPPKGRPLTARHSPGRFALAVFGSRAGPTVRGGPSWSTPPRVGCHSVSHSPRTA